jgi:hypothetical protein
MWRWRRIEKISWTHHVRNKEVLHKDNGERNVIHIVRRKEVNWIGHILHRNGLLKHSLGGKVEQGIEETERQERRRKQLLDDHKETRGYWKLKQEALDHSVENSLWKRQWTCRKTDCGMNE